MYKTKTRGSAKRTKISPRTPPPADRLMASAPISPCAPLSIDRADGLNLRIRNRARALVHLSRLWYTTVRMRTYTYSARARDALPVTMQRTLFPPRTGRARVNAPERRALRFFPRGNARRWAETRVWPCQLDEGSSCGIFLSGEVGVKSCLAVGLTVLRGMIGIFGLRF